MEVARTSSGETVDDLVDQLAGVGFERCDLARAELGIHQPAVLGVVRRIDLQRDERAILADVDGDQIRREDLGMPERELHVLVPADDVRSFDALEHRDRTVLAQRGVERHRLGRDLGTVRVGLALVGPYRFMGAHLVLHG